MKTELFNYELDKKFIASSPASPRDSSKLLVYDTSRDLIFHRKFSQIGEFLKPADVLVLNSSKVIPARFLFELEGGMKEIFILKNLGKGFYDVMVKPGRFFKVGRVIDVPAKGSIEVLKLNHDGTRRIKSDFKLENFGSVPLPPYIQNADVDFDAYQTVYAKEPGSVAAPTAGLHFTKNLIHNLKSDGVKFEKVVLHVGLGTFLPVKTVEINDHFMHKEFFEISEMTLRNLLKAKSKSSRVIAVGTTSMRVLESVAKTGFKNLNGETDIFIYPGAYKWLFTDALVTNFHLPKSTLMMLLASFLKFKKVKNPIKKLLKLYEIAKEMNYRFYSFGDAMFIF